MSGRLFLALLMIVVLAGCTSNGEKKMAGKMKFTGKNNEVVFMTVDPGHFHAALVQKKMYDQVSPEVFVFAPAGPDVEDHLNRIRGYNERAGDPTAWIARVYTGDDFLEKMIREHPGNVMVTAGNNQYKTGYIKAAVDAGIHVFADKPMAITADDFDLLRQAFESAKKNQVLLYDIMTERYEITTILQRELSMIPAIFGTLETGSPEHPAISKESVHHFFKYVSGNKIKRPAWFFDVSRQGEGIVDVTTHLVDLIQWECFPEQVIDYRNDIELLRARHWPTMLEPAQFRTVTGLPEYPEYLNTYLVQDSLLNVYSNGEMIYRINGIHARVSVIWNYEAPEGAGDTHFSVMRGTKARLVIQQGEKQGYIPELYIEPAAEGTGRDYQEALYKAFVKISESWPGVSLEKLNGSYRVVIPEVYRNGHEAHFAQVTEKFLRYLVDGKLPDWEIPNMIAKYYTTTKALEMARSLD